LYRIKNEVIKLLWIGKITTLKCPFFPTSSFVVVCVLDCSHNTGVRLNLFFYASEQFLLISQIPAKPDLHPKDLSTEEIKTVMKICHFSTKEDTNKYRGNKLY
jgi:hypothetical protein